MTFLKELSIHSIKYMMIFFNLLLRNLNNENKHKTLPRIIPINI